MIEFTDNNDVLFTWVYHIEDGLVHHVALSPATEETLFYVYHLPGNQWGKVLAASSENRMLLGFNG